MCIFLWYRQFLCPLPSAIVEYYYYHYFSLMNVISSTRGVHWEANGKW